MTSSQLTSMDRYYKGSPYKGFGYDYYLTKSNDTILLKNLQFSNLKADGTNPSIEINILKGAYKAFTKSYSITKSDFLLESLQFSSSKGTYKFDIYNTYKSGKAHVKSDIVFETLDYYSGFSTKSNTDITFGYEKSTIKNYDPLSKTLKAYISNNYLADISKLNNTIYFVKEINYIYKGDSVYKSYNFYKNGNPYPQPTSNQYNIDMDINIQPNSYLYQEVILYKGIKYNGQYNNTFTTKHNHHFWDDYIKGIEKAINEKGTLTMIPWDSSNSEYDYYMSKGNNIMVLKGLTYKGINITDFEITNINIDIYEFKF